MSFWDSVKKMMGITPFNEINPQEYKSELTLSTPAVEKMYSSTMGNLLRGSTQNTHNMLLANASGQMPGGALSAAMARANEGLASGMATASPQIQQLRMNALARYIGMQSQYDQAKMQHEYQNLANVAATLGALTNFGYQAFGGGGNQSIFGAGQSNQIQNNQGQSNIGIHLNPQNLPILAQIGGM